MRNIILLSFLLVSLIGFSQKQPPFSGRMIYRIDFVPSLDSMGKAMTQSKMVIYTNDTLVRVESETQQFGQQVLIKHLQLQKYYLMLQFEGQKFAIQQHVPADTVPSKYTFKKKLFGKKMISGIKAKRVMVRTETFTKPIEMWYFPSVSPKYLDVLKGIKGLPVDYYIQMENGFLHYVLESIESSPVNMDLFGIPTDFRKVTFDQFIDEMMKSQGGE